MDLDVLNVLQTRIARRESLETDASLTIDVLNVLKTRIARQESLGKETDALTLNIDVLSVSMTKTARQERGVMYFLLVVKLIGGHLATVTRLVEEGFGVSAEFVVGVPLTTIVIIPRNVSTTSVSMSATETQTALDPRTVSPANVLVAPRDSTVMDPSNVSAEFVVGVPRTPIVIIPCYVTKEFVMGVSRTPIVNIPTPSCRNVSADFVVGVPSTPIVIIPRNVSTKFVLVNRLTAAVVKMSGNFNIVISIISIFFF